ncbi:MAG: hypothetical protein PHV33_11785 [Elusimicrobiales bacterium]|nr:hypothetical protein [Elusimicrobiales bacterium]
MIGIIIQARMGSTRLPGKVLKKIGPKTLLAHILYRLEFLKTSATLVVATGDSSTDNPVQRFCAENGVRCFRGSEANVLERYYLCAKQYGFSDVVRMTGDNPFPDIEELDRLIRLYKTSDADFCHSFKSLPIGVGAEIFSIAALARSYREGKAQHHVEHVDEYILEHPELFKTSELEVDKTKNRPDVRLTVDTDEDYRRACFIVGNARGEFVSTLEAIELCSHFA